MVRAIIDRRKTKTRRLVVIRPEHTGGKKKVRPDPVFDRVSVGEYSPEPEDHRVPRIFGAMFTAPNGADLLVKCPYGRPGDELYVRESFSYREYDRSRIEELDPMFWYWADGNQSAAPFYDFSKPKPSIHMPAAAVRIRLQLESVRVERLLAITREDVRAEGVPENWMESDPVFFQQKGMAPAAHHVWDNMLAVEQWRFFWDAMNGAGSSAEDPWVWVLGFSVLEAPEKVDRFAQLERERRYLESLRS